jgi:hypothetical protein
MFLGSLVIKFLQESSLSTKREGKEMESPKNIRDTLTQFHCTEQYWFIFPNNTDFKITDGTKAMAEICEAYWLITAIFSWQGDEKVSREPFQVWSLRFNDKTRGESAVLLCEDGNHHEVVRQDIECTDFPLAEGIKLFLEGGVLLLPSEY